MDGNATREIFAKNLRKIADEKKITQADMAAMTKCSSATVSDWFNGKKYPRPNRMQRIADILGVCMSDLIENHASSAESISPASALCQIDASEENLLEKYRNLDGYGKEVVDLVLDAEHRRVSEQQDTVEFAARSGQRGKVNRVDNLDDLLPPADEDPSHI